MAFPDLPGTSVVVNDGLLRVATTPGTPKVLILGVTDKTTHSTLEPIRIVGSVNAADFDKANGDPSEISKAIQEASDAGADNIEAMIIDTNLSIANDDRFNSLASAYPLLLDHDADIVVLAGVGIDSALSSDNNFAYQLANFCYQSSINFNSVIGVVGMEEINSGSISLAQMSAWVTAAKAYDTSSINGDAFTIFDGTTDTGPDGVPDNFAFYATTDETIPTGSPPSSDGQVVTDTNNQPVDIGKYISVVGGQYRFFNGIASRVSPANKYYDGDGAAAYAGLIARLPSESGTTNKNIAGPTIIRNFSLAQANDLSNRRIVVFRDTRDGVKVTNGRTGAWRIDANNKSDFTQLTTVRIVNEAIEAARDVCNPFVGEPNSGIARQAMKAEVDARMAVMIRRGALQKATTKIISTPTMQTLGQVKVQLTLVPAFEITDITVEVSLASS